jgi:Meiotically up-regulated gene 113
MTDDRALLPFEEEGTWPVRRQWHDGQWYLSIIDVVRVLTDSAAPLQYWRDQKKRMQGEGWQETLQALKQLKMRSPDGKLRLTDCAEAKVIEQIMRDVPATAPWRVKRKDRPQDTLYVVGPQDGGMVKIGFSSNIARRLRSLQCGSPVPLAVLWQTPGGYELERWLHLRFTQRRAYGEWFDFRDTDAVAVIESAVGERAA